MNFRWQRFINQRTLMIIAIMLLISLFLSLREHIIDGDDTAVYQHHRLIVDSACDITQTVCSSSRDGLRVRLALMDSPGALQPFPAQVQIDGLPGPETIQVRLVFSMKSMDMGDLKQALHYRPDTGDWGGQVILPICTSGRSDWLARVEVLADKNIYTAEYAFMLAK